MYTPLNAILSHALPRKLAKPVIADHSLGIRYNVASFDYNPRERSGAAASILLPRRSSALSLYRLFVFSKLPSWHNSRNNTVALIWELLYLLRLSLPS